METCIYAVKMRAQGRAQQSAEAGAHIYQKCGAVSSHLNESEGDDCSRCFECHSLGGSLEGGSSSKSGLEACGWEEGTMRVHPIKNTALEAASRAAAAEGAAWKPA